MNKADWRDAKRKNSIRKSELLDIQLDIIFLLNDVHAITFVSLQDFIVVVDYQTNYVRHAD